MLGLMPGQPAPPPILQPPQDFPPLDRRPLELRNSDVDDYLLTVKQELRQQMKQSHFYLKAGSQKKEVEKYSDRYQLVKLSEMDNQLGWEADWKYFPDELKIVKCKKKKKSVAKFSPVVVKKRTSKKRTSSEKEQGGGGEATSPPAAKRKKQVSFANEVSGAVDQVTVETENKLNELEKLENTSAEIEEEEVVTEDEIYDEEIEEEGTDYNLTYFDNGEDYLGEEDNLEDNEGPYY